MAGPRTPTDVMPNKFVEANGYAREVVERTFRFSPKNLGIFAVFGIAVPVIIYKGCVAEFVSASPEPQPRPRFIPDPRRARTSPRVAREASRARTPPARPPTPPRARPRPRGGGNPKNHRTRVRLWSNETTGERASRFPFRFARAPPEGRLLR